jgi:F0F1-type ATP synthase assembly protein I
MKQVARALALATQLGVTMGLMTVGTVLAGLFLGTWVDRQFGTRPLATLLFVLMGTLAGLLGTVNLARSTMQQLNTAASQQVEARTAFSARALGRAIVLVVALIVVTLAPVGLGLYFGLQLDRATHSSPTYTIVLATVGIITALVGVFLVTVRAARRSVS